MAERVRNDDTDNAEDRGSNQECGDDVNHGLKHGARCCSCTVPPLTDIRALSRVRVRPVMKMTAAEPIAASSRAGPRIVKIEAEVDL